MLERMTEWVWTPGRETNGWELGGRPDLLPENKDDEQDGDNGPKDLRYVCNREAWGCHLKSKRKNGEEISIVVFFAEKENQEENLVAKIRDAFRTEGVASWKR